VFCFSRICFLFPATPRCVVLVIPRYQDTTVAKHSVSRRGGSPYLSEEFQFRTTANKDSRSNPRNLYPYNRLHFAAYQRSFCCCGSAHFGTRIRLTYERNSDMTFIFQLRPHTYLCAISTLRSSFC